MYRKFIILFITCVLFGQFAYCGDYLAGFTLFDERAYKYSPDFQTGAIDHKAIELFNSYNLNTWPTLREMTAQFYRKYPTGSSTNLLMTVISVLREMQGFSFPPGIKQVLVFIITDGEENWLKGDAYTRALTDVEKEITKAASNTIPIMVYIVEARPKYSDDPRPGLTELKILSGNNPARHFKLPDFRDSNSPLNRLLDQVAATEGECACYFIIDRSYSLNGVDNDIEYTKDLIKEKVLAKEERKSEENKPNEFAIIPSGEYVQGADDYEDDEAPAHKRMIESFKLGVTPVTEAQYYAVMGPPEKAERYKASKKPVTGITFFDAVNYCNKRSETEKRRPAYKILDDGTVLRVPGVNGYYLPSEAQIQYSARAGTTTLFPTGNTLSKDEFNMTGEIMEVAMFKPNAWGLYDAIGSIRQWTDDFYDEYRPDAGFNPPVKGATRVCYGASFRDKDKQDRYRFTYRFHHEPGHSDEYLGFRVAFSE